MAQVIRRAPDELVDRVRRAARERGHNVNEYVPAVLAAATDPELATSEAARVRERLAAAGLLAPGHDVARRPDPEVVARARSRAGKGTSLSMLISEGR